MHLGKLKVWVKSYIGGKEDPLLIRWILFRVPAFGIFLHKFCRSDYDRALHCHPWTFISGIIKGGYYEYIEDTGLQGEPKYYKPGAILYRPAEWKHRVVLPTKDGKYIPSWSLIIVFRRRRYWGFWPNGHYCWWRKYNLDSGICEENIVNGPEEVDEANYD